MSNPPATCRRAVAAPSSISSALIPGDDQSVQRETPPGSRPTPWNRPRFIADEDQVERTAVHLLQPSDHLGQGESRGQRIPVGAVGLEQDGSVDTDGQRVRSWSAASARPSVITTDSPPFAPR